MLTLLFCVSDPVEVFCTACGRVYACGTRFVGYRKRMKIFFLAHSKKIFCCGEEVAVPLLYEAALTSEEVKEMVRKLDRKKLRAIDLASLMPEALDGLVQEKLLIEVMLNEAQLHAN